MPNRILKGSICESESIDKLSPFEEVTFYRLLVNADDYGRMDARTKIVKSKLFPLRDIRIDQIDKALKSLASAELVTLYEVDGKPFLQIVKWNEHQVIRNKRSKYPPPPQSKTEKSKLKSIEINCNQLHANVSVIQSESESESESEVEDARARADAATTAFDGSDLTDTIRNNETVDQLIKRYGLADKEPTREALLEDLETHGFDKLNSALQTAAESDTRGGISVRFWRAILTGSGKCANAKSNTPQGRFCGTGDMMARHEYTKEDFRAMVIDLDEEDT